MSRPQPVLVAIAAALTVIAGGCGDKIETADPAQHAGAELFNQRCSGCHTLKAAAARGSSPPGHVKYKERTDGPNFDVRKEEAQDVLFAIRNGGFSGAIMPANVVVGQDAAKVAEFVCIYAGQSAPRPASECKLPPGVVSGTGPAPSGQKKPSAGNAPKAGPPEAKPTTPGGKTGAGEPGTTTAP